MLCVVSVVYRSFPTSHMAKTYQGKQPAAKKQKVTQECSSASTSDFSSRSIKIERFVVLGQLMDTPIPKVAKTLKWEKFLQQGGKANATIVREFYRGINPKSINYSRFYLESKVRGVKVKLSADIIASVLGIPRPKPGTFQYPYLKEEDYPNLDDVANSIYVDEMVNQKRWQVKFLKAEMSVLTLVLRANLDPRGTKASFNDNFARLLYETSRCTPIDVGSIIWQVVESVVKSEDSPALPFGLLVTKICSSAGVESLENDEL